MSCFDSLILIFLGGDGGILREVTKHGSVEEIVHVEIDEGVIHASKQFFPTMAEAFSDKRLKLTIADAVGYVKDAPENYFDVIIVDSSDPDGPAEKLFSKEFYQNASRILTEKGIMASQGECLWIHQELMQGMRKMVLPPEEKGDVFMPEGNAQVSDSQSYRYFRSAEYASIQVPTYPCGQICAFVLSKNNETCELPVRRCVGEEAKKMRYYSSRMHAAAFVLPVFLEEKLGIRRDD